MAIPSSISLKLDRAQEHLLSIDSEIASYLDREPYKLIRNVQPSDQKLVLIEFHVITEPDERIGVIVGDCLHNLRSALDHLACYLVTKNKGMITKKTQFPILDVRPTDKKTGQPLRPKIDGGVADNVLTVIDLLQPYQNKRDAHRHPLWLLSELSNADKHRLLHVAIACLGNPKFRITLPDGTVWDGQPSVRIAHHETPLFAIKLPQAFDVTLYGQMQVETQGSAFIGLKESGPWDGVPVTLLLNQILKFVRYVTIARLHPFLE
jgi:hypothetical protein